MTAVDGKMNSRRLQQQQAAAYLDDDGGGTVNSGYAGLSYLFRLPTKNYLNELHLSIYSPTLLYRTLLKATWTVFGFMTVGPYKL